jgi:hypothetical protein
VSDVKVKRFVRCFFLKKRRSRLHAQAGVCFPQLPLSLCKFLLPTQHLSLADNAAGQQAAAAAAAAASSRILARWL